MVDLNSRLKNLGFVPASSLKDHQVKIFRNIEDELGGYRVKNNQGEVIIIEKTFPYGSSYGNFLIQNDARKDEIYKFCKTRNTTISEGNLVFIDTETTGLGGGTGTIPFIIGYGFYNENGFITRQIFLDDPTNELVQLNEFSRDIDNFDTTVTFNGKSFDLPLLRTRFVLSKLPVPFEQYSHIDLLHIARKLWKNRLTDRSLKVLESNILDFTRSQDDIPGWLIPQVYFDFLKTGESSQLINVVYHNQLDIVSMAVLFEKIKTIFTLSEVDNSIDPMDLYSIAKMYFHIGEFEQAISLFEKCLYYIGDSQKNSMDIHMSLAEIFKKRNEYAKSIPHWTACIAMNNIQACIEMAKYFEHHEKNLLEANYWASKAYNLVEVSSKPKYERNHELKIIQKRIARLSRRKENV